MRRRLVRSLLAGLAVAITLSACSAAQIVDVLTPGGGYRVERDVAYGDDPRQRLDLYVPDRAAPDAPVVVFFYGGRWESGAKEMYRFAGQAFASRGYITAIPDYRLYPQVRWQGFLADGAAAVAAVGRRLEGRRLVLAGHSAGAYIAAMLALDRRWLRAAGTEHCRIGGTIGLAGPYDFLPLDSDDLRQIFGPGPAGPETQPITFAEGGLAPMLLMTGADDSTVRPRNTERLAARLRAAGTRVETRHYDGVGHVRIVAALAAPLRFLAPVLDDADAFLKALDPAPACGPRS